MGRLRIPHVAFFLDFDSNFLENTIIQTFIQSWHDLCTRENIGVFVYFSKNTINKTVGTLYAIINDMDTTGLTIIDLTDWAKLNAAEKARANYRQKCNKYHKYWQDHPRKTKKQLDKLAKKKYNQFMFKKRLDRAIQKAVAKAVAKAVNKALISDLSKVEMEDKLKTKPVRAENATGLNMHLVCQGHIFSDTDAQLHDRQSTDKKGGASECVADNTKRTTTGARPASSVCAEDSAYGGSVVPPIRQSWQKCRGNAIIGVQRPSPA